MVFIVTVIGLGLIIQPAERSTISIDSKCQPKGLFLELSKGGMFTEILHY